MRYEDYIDLNYIPTANDLSCEFLVEPARGVSIERAAGAVAAESSIGTWTETTTAKPYVERLAAKAFEISGKIVKIAYPAELFEPGNMPNLLSSIAGNIFGMKEIKALRLNRIRFPKKILKSFKGPKYGIAGVRKILKIPKRPLLGTIIKPKLGLNTGDHVKVAYQAWLGGCDIVKDDENLASQSFNRFSERLEKTFRAKERAEHEIGEKKAYIINVTAETEEMLKRAKLVENIGNEYVMVDIITAGWAAIQTLRNRDFNLILHGHRAGHAALTKNPRHGISMAAIATLTRIVGFDQLHVGTAVGKMFETERHVRKNVAALREKMDGIKPVLPVASGGLWAGHVPRLLKIFGNDVVIQAGGGIHGHPKGSRYGAMSMREAIDAVMEGLPLKEYAKTKPALRAALEKWSK